LEKERDTKRKIEAGRGGSGIFEGGKCGTKERKVGGREGVWR
jgi:hypothetical protein